MKRAIAVIGANAGDEGKGKMVDFFASRIPGDKVVVRFNSGAQCGHTVVTPDGRRHVFGHFGSGVFTGAETYLAKHFVINPILFWKEHRELIDKLDGLMPAIAADPRCYVTTPYDMMINQAVEDSRGMRRHGSTGIGFGETIERNQYVDFRLMKQDLDDAEALTKTLKAIRDNWLPARLQALRARDIARTNVRLSDTLLDKFVEAAVGFERAVQTAGLEFLSDKEIIFEGGQGLLLDMDNKEWFPHVTRSNPGLRNVAEIGDALGGLAVYAVYVSRGYLTRHGAGPLPGEFTPAPPIVDETNIDHPYQGKLRFGYLDIDAQMDRIHRDVALWKSSPMPIMVRLAFTCLDHTITQENVKALVHRRVPSFVSTGPCRDDVKEC